MSRVVAVWTGPVSCRADVPLSDKSPQGILVDHHQGSDGSDYVRFVFGKRPKGAAEWKMDEALDAEFLFLAGQSKNSLAQASHCIEGIKSHDIRSAPICRSGLSQGRD